MTGKMALIGASLLAFVQAAPALAQGATNDAEAAEASTGITDIVVTARRRSESLQSVPATISAINTEGMEKTGVRQLGDLTKTVSGLAFAAAGGAQPLISLRGDFNRVGNTEPGVGVFTDGVFITRFTQLSQNPVDVSRIEILKGPQSTLYGKNTVAGAMNVVSADPTFDWSGYVDAGYGRSSQSENIYHMQGAISGPLVEDKVAIRIAGSYANRDGYVYNPANGFRGQGYSDHFVRGKLLFRPAENLEIKITGVYNKRNAPRADTLLRVTGILPFANAAIPMPNAYGATIWDWKAETNPYSRSESYMVIGEINLDTSIGKLTSITGWQKSKVDQLTDTDTTQYPLVTQLFFDRDTAFSQEIRLAGSASRFQWLAGAYYLKDRNSLLGQQLNFLQNSSQFAGGAAVQYIAGPTNTETIGVFGQLGFDLTDKLNVTGGLRYASDAKHSALTFFLTGTNGLTAPGAFTDLKRDKTFTSLTGNVVVTYKVSPNARFYASYSTGNKAGGFSFVGNAAAAVIPYDEQNVKAFEVGFKSDLFDNRLRLNADFFYNDITNLQVPRAVQVGAGQFNLTQNAGSTKVPGADVEIAAEIAQGLILRANYTYQDAKIKTYQFTPTVQLSDIQVPRSPTHSGNIGLDYTAKMGNGSLNLGGNLNFRSSFNNDINYNAATATVLTLRAPGYETVNLNAGYSWDRFQIRAYVNNLFNKQYVIGGAIVAPPFDQLVTPGEPRTFEISLKITI